MKNNSDDYQSPDFYAFSADSILLAKAAIAEVLPTKIPRKVLDLGAGCGVVGIEFLNFSPKNQSWNLSCCEMQTDFRPYLLENLRKYEISAKTYFVPFQELTLPEKFDVILFNPPYFDEKNGRPAKDLQRHLCRFFKNNFFSDLELFIAQYLAPDGSFYFLYREDQINPTNYFSNNKYQIKTLFKVDASLRLVCVLKL